MLWHLAPPLAQFLGPLAQLAGGSGKTLGSELSTPIKLLIAVGIVIASIVLGKVLSKAARLPDHDWRIGLIVFATLAGIIVCVLGWPPKLGIDLGGGANLVYEVDQSKKDASVPLDMGKLIAAVSERINPGGQREITIRPYGPEQIEIIVPEVDQDELARLKKVITNIGSLEFRILANNRDHADLIAAGHLLKPNERTVKRGGKEAARWVPLKTKNDVPVDGFIDDGNLASRVNARGNVEMLVVIDPFNVTGGYLTNSRASRDNVGRPSVDFRFNSEGASKFASLTSENLPDQGTGFSRRLGIILDDFLSSAPSIQSTIHDQGEITGDFTMEEVDEIVATLNAGSLPTALSKEPVTELTTSPTLGEDTIRKGTIAIAASVVVVVAFMIFYYRFAGLVAGLAVALNMVLTVAVAIAIQAPFSLAGLAGLALTLGMAVDANVLIYERLREEMARGATLRMAIRNGFSRAMTTIIDSNVTTLIIAVVLYWIGTDAIKGFAVMLFLGLVISMFTACFCARVAFDICEKLGWLRQLRMRQLFAVPNFDFVGRLWMCVGISTVVIVVGLAAMWVRGIGMFNIDFIGGTVVETLFTTPQDIAVVRQKVGDLPDVTVGDVAQADESSGMRFKIETSLDQIDKVEAEITRRFPGILATNKIVEKRVAMVTGEASPAEQPPSNDTPSNGTTTETPAEGEAQPADDAAEPKSNDGARRRDPADRWLASADAGSLLLAQADDATPADPESDAAPTDETGEDAVAEPTESDQPDAGGTSEDATSEDATSEDATSEDATSEDAGADEAGADEAGADEAGADEADVSDVGATESAAVSEKDAFIGKTQATLVFREPLTHDTLADFVREALVSPALKESGALDSTPFELSNAGYVQGSSASYNAWDLKVALPLAAGQLLVDQLEQLVSSNPYFPSTSKVGAKVADRAAQNAIVALLASFLFITIYLWVRFQKVTYGVAAVVALIHDVLVALAALAVSYWLAPYLGFVMMEQFKIDLTVVAALLTIIGFSVNDTVVIFDRIREVKGKSPVLTGDMINASINQTLSRTVLTSLTVLLVTVILYIWGGPSIHAFAFTFLVGVITGTYSTVYVAAPILLWMQGGSIRETGQGSTKIAGAGGGTLAAAKNR